MVITAPSLRRSWGDEDLEAHTTNLLNQFDGMIRHACGGNKAAKDQLEKQLLYSQQAAHANPFVSFTYEWGVAVSFALKGNSAGYILTARGDSASGVDFESLRSELDIFVDGVDFLREFGLRRRLEDPFQLISVETLAPFGAATVRVYP